MTQPSTHWNAEVYDRIGKPMRRWAQAVIDDLHLRGDETVLDAGCGSGSVTFDLLERLPGGQIYAIDSSPDMIAKITRAIEERGITNITPIRASLTDFELPEPVDVVFSNAVLHWIPDDDALFSCLHRATKPGGHFRAQCGGGNNIVFSDGHAKWMNARQTRCTERWYFPGGAYTYAGDLASNPKMNEFNCQ